MKNLYSCDLHLLADYRDPSRAAISHPLEDRQAKEQTLSRERPNVVGGTSVGPTKIKGEANVKFFTRLAIFIFLSGGFMLNAVAAEPPGIWDVFVCNYSEGKDASDIAKAIPHYARQLEKLGIDNERAFIWTPSRSTATFDYLWISSHPNVQAYASNVETYRADPARDRKSVV